MRTPASAMINGHVVWEIVDEQAELPMVTIENSPELGAEHGRSPRKTKRRKRPCCPTRP